MSKEGMEINFKESLEVVKILEELSEFLARIAEQDFAETLAAIQGNWEGEAAEVFLKKGDDFYQKMKQSADDLITSAEAVKQAAEKIYDAEQKAAAIALKRKYR